MLRKFEILAPARNLECGIEAIKCGTDSVYIGYNKFGLRKVCQNGIRSIKQLINFAHRYWAKVYVTLNSSLYNLIFYLWNKTPTKFLPSFSLKLELTGSYFTDNWPAF